MTARVAGYRSGMFLLFGLRTKDHLLGSPVLRCEICGWDAPQSVYRRSTKFTLFFVPLFPVSPGKYYLRCHHCQGMRQTSADAARHATAAR